MSTKPRDYFSISVKIIEARDLPHPNISSLACVRVGKERKCTRTIKHTDSPQYNEYFTFDLLADLPAVMKTVVSVELYEPRRLRVKKLIGCISLEASTVWGLEDRRLKRWLVVTIPSDATASPKGFVSCDIIIEASEKYLQVPNLVPVDMPDVLGGLTGRFMVRIYRCVGLDVHQFDQAKEVPDVFVRISFANKSETTTKRKLRENPEWNEQILFIELLPPLFQKITVDLYVGKKRLASQDFYLTKISHISKEGFLPTYGPTFVHLYEKGLQYRASLFMAIDTEQITLFKYKEKLHAVLRQTIQPNIQPQLIKLESFLCFGIVFDVVLQNQKPGPKNVSVSLDFGKQPSSQTNSCHTETENFRTVQIDSETQYIPLKGQKPCVFMKSDWPDTRNRLNNSNVISNLHSILKERVDYAQNLLTRGSDSKAEAVLKAALHKFKNDCNNVPEQLTIGTTKYDKERIKLLTKLLAHLSSIVVKENSAESLVERSNVVLSALETMYEDVQDSLPLIFISVKEGDKVIGYCKVHPREIIYSQTDIKRGFRSGKIITRFLSTPDAIISGKIDVWLWLGLWTQIKYSLLSIPPGHNDITKAVALPVALTYSTSEKYAAICHVYRGNIFEGGGEGTCDSFVKVWFSCKSKQTNKVKGSLSPLWNETFVIADVPLYPEPSHFETSSPVLTVELWDGSQRPEKLIGSAFVEPKVRLQPIIKELEYILEWLKVGDSEVLGIFEIIQLPIERRSGESVVISDIKPEFLDPPVTSYRLEVVFWGIRGNNIKGLKGIAQPQAIVQCGSVEIRSEFVVRGSTFFNFKHDLHSVILELPKTKFYSPSLILRLTTSAKYFGSTTKRNVFQYLTNLPTEKEWKSLSIHRKSVVERAEAKRSTILIPDLIPLIEQEQDVRTSLVVGRQNALRRVAISLKTLIKELFSRFKNLFRRVERTMYIEPEIEEDDEERDWWFSYATSEITIYKHKLEDVKEFRKFNDVLKTFEVKQKDKGYGEAVARVKIMMSLYKWPVKTNLVTTQGQDPDMSVLQHTQLSESVELLVRVYCVKAYNLHPADPNGSADPFIEIGTPSRVVSDTSNYINRQLNPVFGKCLEITAEFPIDTLLSVRVMDYDRISAHDLIGETIVDLEDRFYSKHRGTCGLAPSYSSSGYDMWRDVEKPTEILEKLCNVYNLPLPQYFKKSVLVASKEFTLSKGRNHKGDTNEKLALQALRHWDQVPIIGLSLVPEHVETRSLYHPKRPGIEQGKLEMWVDIFDLSSGTVPPPVDITPRKPQNFELRVVIWNTSKVLLVDNSFLVGKKHTDIFVKGWLWDTKSSQQTDVHYTSINGTGNFNWRFVFPLLYYRAEKKMVIYHKGVFNIEKTEIKVPAMLYLQVWDNDRLSPNDFIGAMEFELCRVPRGARSVRTCNVNEYKNPKKTVDLFRVRHIKGWWPFVKVEKDEKSKCGGFLEAEFHLLTDDEAAHSPAGLGRSEPSPLPPPLRPEFRIKFWLAPFRILCHLLCGVHRVKVILALIIVALAVFAIVGFYSIPMFLIKKIMRA